ncbi:hypothetical protein 2AX2_36 [uncultured Caudovirales phage]|uniref:Uncharacterized protein n=1 Tax=uncultured Caudovirales phage TaxID=2100421 RepID=A0A2H4IZL0_9CAUD|nr:hypothetical protein 2AX2_36 [uncultured Caudovirales phage]
MAHSKTWRGLIYLSAWQLEVSHPVSNGPDLLHPQEANPATYEGSHALGEREELKPADDRQGQATTDSALHDHLAPCTATVGDSKDSHRTGQRSRIEDWRMLAQPRKRYRPGVWFVWHVGHLGSSPSGS